MINKKIRSSLYLRLSHTFLGKIGFNIRGIQIEYKDREISIKCYFDGQITDEDYEEVGKIETEMISSIDGDYNIVCSGIRVDSPSSLPWDNSTEWFYLRKEK